jgi:TadE-like protein
MPKTKLSRRLRRAALDDRGATIVEFAIILPVMLTFLMGTFDVGYDLYARAMLNGAMEKASRDSGVLGGASQTAIIDGRVRTIVNAIVKTESAGNSLVFSRKNYVSLSDVGEMEDFTDSDGDSECDLGEPFEDANNNSVWDDRGNEGQGGARAAVLYTATLTYKRLFPVHALIGLPENAVLKSTTVLRNQPYDTNLAAQPVQIKHCTLADT